MSYDIAKAFPIGSYRASTATALAGLLGTVVIHNNKTYRLVQNGASDITSPQYKAVSTAFTLGVPTYVVGLPTVVTGVGKAGIIPSDYGTTTIPASAYFWVQISGPTSGLAATTTILNGLALSANTSGQIALIPATATADVAAIAYHGYSTNSAAVTAAGLAQTMILDGILP